MRKSIIAGCVLAGAALGATAGLADKKPEAPANSMMMSNPMMASSKPAMADAKLIQSAMSAAPMSVTRNATIVVMEADGKMRTLRKGTNAFTCVPDDPSSPGRDPMCLDKNGWDWLMAYAGHKTPAAGKIGFVFMLAGGSDASNTDPYASKPAANSHWITTGPHVMVVGADASYYAAYPTGPDPDTSVPYVMWAGTPYQHTMIPVK
jgi:hypothetical protein